VRGLQRFGSLFGLASPDEDDVVKRVIAVAGQNGFACCDGEPVVFNDSRWPSLSMDA